MNDFLKVLVLLAIGAVISNVIVALSKPEASGFFTKANNVLKWGIKNAYGLDDPTGNGPPPTT